MTCGYPGAAKVRQGTPAYPNHPKALSLEGDPSVLLTVSAATFFGVLLVVMLRLRAVGFGGALVAALFGFYLASTRVAPAVNQALADVFRSLPGLH